jgi:DNA repair exonuclease SbcCD ATPase subunit
VRIADGVELTRKSTGDASIRLEHIGGIEEAAVEFSPGVTILVGRNATNRTSLLQGLMAGLGSDRASVKADADRAEVELTLDGERYTRRLERRSGTVVADGEPYLEDPTLADLFAFLLESNEARRAVARGDDLRDLIMRPVDVDAIEAEIDRLLAERQEVEAELDELDSLKGTLPELEAERNRLEDRIEEKRAELEAAEAELEAAEFDVETGTAEEAELEEKLEELRATRSRLDDVRYDVETERESLDALREERHELEAEREALPETPSGEIEELDARIDRLRERREELKAAVNDLQSVIGFNEELLDGATGETFDVLGGDDTPRDDAGGSVTDRLLDDEVTCWTCGSRVEADQIRSTVDRLRELSRSKLSEVNELESEISDLDGKRRELEDARRERDRIDRRLSELDAEIERDEARLERLRERREELTGEVETLETAVEELEADSHGQVLDRHREANELEYELGRLENDRDRVEENIASIESQLGREADLEARREELREEIEELRVRIERIEREAVEQFNEHMDALLDLLGYENLDRIWLERIERGQGGRGTATEGAFELHVIRSTDSGAAYEDTVEHLSESEREVTGLVFALAGYLAHEVYETVPFMLLDSLEAIDSERIATLVDYLDDYTGYLVVALLPEDASALPSSYGRVTEI